MKRKQFFFDCFLITNFVAMVFGCGSLPTQQNISNHNASSEGKEILPASIQNSLMWVPLDTKLKPSGCLLPKGVYPLQQQPMRLNERWFLTFSSPPEACKTNTGWLEDGEWYRDSVFSVIQATWFKRYPKQSQDLTDGDKCLLPLGLYLMNDFKSPRDRHFQFTLRENLESCAFDRGYVFEGHGNRGVTALTVTTETVFKRYPKQSYELQDEDKCTLPEGTMMTLAPAQEAEKGHYSMLLAKPPKNCSFDQGYVYHKFTTFSPPDMRRDYLFPMLGGLWGSRWCVCRNIGSSPHIGQDIYRGGPMKSIAVADSRVLSITFGQSCGYAVMLEDRQGGVWRYMHLNYPRLRRGQRVRRGSLIGINRDYPRSGCGTGPHLHFERRTPGGFRDTRAGRSCQYGYRRCYFDPMLPWRPEEHGVVEEPRFLPSASPCNPNQIKPTWETPNTASSNDEDLRVSIQITSEETHPFVSFTMHLDDRFGANTQNSCQQRECITAASLYRQEHQQWQRIYYSQALRFSPVVLGVDQRYCLDSSEPTNFVVQVRTNLGRKLTKFFKGQPD